MCDASRRKRKEDRCAGFDRWLITDSYLQFPFWPHEIAGWQLPTGINARRPRAGPPARDATGPCVGVWVAPHQPRAARPRAALFLCLLRPPSATCWGGRDASRDSNKARGQRSLTSTPNPFIINTQRRALFLTCLFVFVIPCPISQITLPPPPHFGGETLDLYIHLWKFPSHFS